MRSVITGLLTASLVLGSAIGADGQSPSPGPPWDSVVLPAGIDRGGAVARVLATDPRFAGLPSYDVLEHESAALFSFAPLVTSSYVRVVPTPQTDLADLGGVTFRHPLGWFVETTLVVGCLDRAQLDLGPVRADPCAWRRTWFHHVEADGTVLTLWEAGDPEPMPAPEAAIWQRPTPGS
jgi:hypothetical protein